MEQPLRYACLVASPAGLVVGQIAQALSRHHSILLADAALKARQSWGLVAEDMDKTQAEALAARLDESGAGGIAVPRGIVEDLEPAAPVLSLAFEPARGRAGVRGGESREFSWERVALIAAACYRKITRTQTKVIEEPNLGAKAASAGLFLATGLPISLGGKPKETVKTKETSELAYVLDICLDGPAVRLRVDPADFDFSGLKSKMSYDSSANFRALLAALAAAAPKALRSRGTSVFLAGQPLNSMGYDSPADLERESRWLLTLKALGKT